MERTSGAGTQANAGPQANPGPQAGTSPQADADPQANARPPANAGHHEPTDATTTAGESLASRLTATARGAIAFYEASFPISASVFSDPELLAAHRAAVTGRGGGPQYPLEALARYLRLEQGRGRIRPGADCDAAASLLLGSCFQYAFLRCFAQLPPDPDAAQAHATAIVTTLLAGLQPA